MKINVRTLPDEGLTIEKVLSADDLGISRDDAVVLSPVRLKVRVSKAGEELCCSVEASGTYGFECGRCLTEVKEERTDTFELYTDITPDMDFVDITDDIRQELVVALTSGIVLCLPNCKGLCPNCGVNLNEERCHCPRKIKNPVHIRPEDEGDDKPRRIKI